MKVRETRETEREREIDQRRKLVRQLIGGRDKEGRLIDSIMSDSEGETERETEMT